MISVPAAAQPISQTIEELKPGTGEVDAHADGYLHRPSGYKFPLQLRELPARKTTTYGPGDVDVYYTLYGGGNGDGWINLYVYPANISLVEEVANVTQSIVKGISGEPAKPASEMGASPSGVEEGWFRGSTQGLKLVTGYRVTRVGNWFIKARVSLPVDADEATLKRVGAALNAIDFAPGSLKARASGAKEPVS